MTDHTTRETPERHSLTEEIRLLAELVVERAAPWLDGLVAAGHRPETWAAHTPTETEAGARAEGGCGWCPFCAILAVVRGERPELAARVLEQAAQLVALLRAVLADRWAPEEGVHMPGFEPTPRPAPEEPRATRVQHVPVRPREDWDAGGK